MKRNLIALAIAAAVAAPAVATAEDDIKVYGLAQVEVGSFSYQDNSSKKDTKEDGVQEGDNANGRVGVIATEDLGGGLTGIAKFEFKLDTADGDSSGGIALTARELFVGLKGGFGQAELGRLKSAYKYAGGVAYDPFVATFLEARTNGGMSGGNFGQGGFLSNTIGYSSPKLGPVDIRVTYGPEEDDGSYTASVKAGWKMGEFFVAVADQGDLSKPAEYSALKAGGQLRFGGGAHKISLQYEMIDDGTTTAGDPFYFFGGYDGTFGKAEFVAQLGMYDPDVTVVGSTTETTYMAIGAIYKFSKMTRVFGGYRNTDVDNETGNNVITIGMRKDFK